MYERYAYPDELYHYGVKGMKWGILNEDPKLTVQKLAQKRRAKILAEQMKRAGKSASSATKSSLPSTAYRGPSNVPPNQKSSKDTRYKGPSSIANEIQKANLAKSASIVKANEANKKAADRSNLIASVNGKQAQNKEIQKTQAKDRLNKIIDKGKQAYADKSATEERDARQKEANAQKSVDNLKKSVKSYIEEANKRAKLDVMVGGVGRKAKEAQEESKKKKIRAEVKYLGKHGGGGDHGSRTSTQKAVAKRNNKAKKLVDQINDMAISKKKKKK